MDRQKQNIIDIGFAIINDVYSEEEVDQILILIDQAKTTTLSLRKSAGLFAIRQFLNEIPAVQKLLFSEKLMNIVHQLFGNDYFVTKSIYFDKREQSNWFVAYHQDLTISVDKQLNIPGFTNWTVKQNQFSVQPPIDILQKNFTIRIHLDDTDTTNGALKVISKSHLKGIYRPEMIDWQKESETICEVKGGGIMIMRPLLLHSSGRSTVPSQRRVIHIEFSNRQLPNDLKWSELIRF